MEFSPWVTEDAKEKPENSRPIHHVSHIATNRKKAILLRLIMDTYRLKVMFNGFCLIKATSFADFLNAE
jgi:hypothetical protein